MSTEREIRIESIRNVRIAEQSARLHTPVPMLPNWDISGRDVLAFRKWIQFQYDTFSQLQKTQEALYLNGESDDDGIGIGYAVAAYQRVMDMLDDVIRWGDAACML